MRIVDTHQHLWDLRQFPYTWCAGIPALNRSFTFADYAEASAGAGIEKTVFMECDVDPPHLLAEAQSIQAIAKEHPLISGIVASCRPEEAGFARHVERLAELPLLRGLRRVLHTQPDDLARQPGFAENLRLLPRFGLTFDLCMQARQLPIALELVRNCPQVSFILDHCGVPDVKGRAFHPWMEDIRRLAELPNLACKISGIVAYADPSSWSAEDLKPWVEHVLEHFGWDRVVWGGDWPVCTLSSPLARWVQTTRLLVGHADEAARAKLFHLNAERIYRI